MTIMYRKNMLCFNKVISLLTLLTFTTVFLLSCNQNKRVKELKIAVINDFYPFAYLENDILKGIELDIISHLKTELKTKITFTQYSSTQLLESFYNGDYDIAIGGITVTDIRKEIFNFSQPYYNATQTAVVLQNSTVQIDTLSAISNYRIGVVNNTSSSFFLENNFIKTGFMPINNIRMYNNEDSLIEALKNNQVSIILMENTPVKKIAELHNLKIIFQNYYVEEYAIVFKKNSNYLNIINRVLQTI